MDKSQVEKIDKLLKDNGVEWATLNNFIAARYNALIIPEEKWEAVTTALYNEVGGDGWKDEWDY